MILLARRTGRSKAQGHQLVHVRYEDARSSPCKASLNMAYGGTSTRSSSKTAWWPAKDLMGGQETAVRRHHTAGHLNARTSRQLAAPGAQFTTSSAGPKSKHPAAGRGQGQRAFELADLLIDVEVGRLVGIAQRGCNRRGMCRTTKRASAKVWMALSGIKVGNIGLLNLMGPYGHAGRAASGRTL